MGFKPSTSTVYDTAVSTVPAFTHIAYTRIVLPPFPALTDKTKVAPPSVMVLFRVQRGILSPVVICLALEVIISPTA